MLTKIAEDAIRNERTAGELDRRILALGRAYAGFDEAAVSTIHGFCQQTLLQSAFESRIALDAEPVNDIDELLQEIVDDFWAAELTGAPLEWIELLVISGVSRDELRRLATKVAADPDASVRPEPIESGAEAGSAAQWAEALAALARCWHAGGGARATAALLDLAKRKAFRRPKSYNTSQPKKRAAKLDAWAAAHVGGDARSSWDLVGLSDLSDLRYFAAAAVAHDLADPTALDEVDAGALELFELAEAATAGPAEQFLRRFVDYARTELPRRKAERAVLSFDDLLRTLADRLAEPGARESLRASIRQRFRVALIDEFQDTDPVQWTIFREVFGTDDPGVGVPAYLFLIGDPKQAIYSFRGADLHTYVGARGFASAGRYTMTTNWRSDGRYLAALNQVLGRPGVFGHADVDYVAVDPAPHHVRDGLVPVGATQGQRAPLRLVYFDRDTIKTGKDGFGVAGWASDHLPRHVAEEVVEQLEAGEQLVLDRDEQGDPIRTRPVRPGDIAVLVRANWQAARMQAALLEAGVPAVIEGGSSVFEAPEALDLQRLLEALLRPTSDRTIRSALVGCLFLLTGADLAALTDQDWDRWLGRFIAWAEQWREQGFMVAFRQILEEADVVPGVLSRPGGERVLTNLLQLAELLHGAEQASKLGPVGLIAWLRHRRAVAESRRAGEEEELRLESDADAVTVSTVHASKGLEYPIVWCPWLWDGKGLRDTRLLRVHDPDCDPPQVLDLHLATDRAPKREHIQMAERELRAENLRLLYVALTRARHRCTVYWGPFKQSEGSPLAAVFHGEDGGDLISTGADRVLTDGDEGLFADLERLAAASGGTVEALRAAPLEQLRWETVGPGEGVQVRARVFERARLDTWWRRGSFSSLTRSASHEDSHGEDGAVVGDATPSAEGIDHDDAVTLVGGDEGGGPQLAFPVPLAQFPRGADAGTFLHAVLEYVDFPTGADPASPELGQQLDRSMPRFGIDEVHRAALIEGLGAALRTPFGGPLGESRLADVERGDRLDEMAFDFPVVADGAAAGGNGAVLTSGALARVFADHAREVDEVVPGYTERIAALGFGPPLRGFLTGQIDLIFRTDPARTGPREPTPRWYVVDYKSNWLGERLADAAGNRAERCTVSHYAPARMAEAMAEHHYVLQYHLYMLALHRYLRWRLGQDYDYDTHIGGAYYLFLRGMIGEATPSVTRRWGRQRHGVYFHRPSKSMIEALDRCFATGGAGPGARGGARR